MQSWGVYSTIKSIMILYDYPISQSVTDLSVLYKILLVYLDCM